MSQSVIPDILAQLHTAPVKGKRSYLARRVGVSSMDMNAIDVKRKSREEMATCLTTSSLFFIPACLLFPLFKVAFQNCLLGFLPMLLLD